MCSTYVESGSVRKLEDLRIVTGQKQNDSRPKCSVNRSQMKWIMWLNILFGSYSDIFYKGPKFQFSSHDELRRVNAKILGKCREHMGN
jgi:hypothetical protein